LKKSALEKSRFTTRDVKKRPQENRFFTSLVVKRRVQRLLCRWFFQK